MDSRREQREGNGGGAREGGRERATAEDSRKEAERGNGGGAREEEREEEV